MSQADHISALAKEQGTFRAWMQSLCIAVVFFAAVSPTLSWTQFHDPIENLNIATAMEMRHGGPLLVPNLQGFPRLAKPPLTAWLTALSIRPATLASLDVRDPAARAAAYARLAWDVRLPALIAACLMLIAAYWIGFLCAGETAGLFTACICATQWLFLRHCQLATTDIQIALWVAVTNAFLALCIFRRGRWLGCLGAGVAAGVMFMSKGPVGFVQTIVPMLLFVLIARRLRMAGPRERWRSWIIPATVGVLLTLVIGGWWYAWVAMHYADMFHFWFAEVSRIDADGVPPGNWYKHFLSIYLFMPWVMWLAMGAVTAFSPSPGTPGEGGVRVLSQRESESPLGEEPSPRPLPAYRARDRTAAVLGLLLLFVPLILMSFAKDRFQRYLAPLAPGGALLAAAGVMYWARGQKISKWLGFAHWLTIGGIAVGLPIAMGGGWGKSFQTLAGKPQLPAITAAIIAAGMFVGVVLGVWLQRRWPSSLVVVSAILMLGASSMYYDGFGQTKGGRCELAMAADQIAARFPDASIFVLGNTHKPNVITVYGNELSIYLNRPVHMVPNTSSVPPGTGPQILLLTQGKRAPEVGPIPGWTLMTEMHDANAKYVLYRLPGAELNH